MTRINRRTAAALIVLPAFGLTKLTSGAHEGHSHGTDGATPSASPMAVSPGTGTGAAYFTVTNSGDAPDWLIGGSTPVADLIEVHEMVMENDVMKMAELKDGLEVPAGGEAVLEPQSYHLMLIDLTQDILPDTTYPLALQFRDAGEIEVTVMVQTEAPEDPETFTVGDLSIIGPWTRPAPMLTAGTDHAGDHHHEEPEASPEHEGH